MRKLTAFLFLAGVVLSPAWADAENTPPTAPAAPDAPMAPLTREQLLARMKLVADWQLAHPGSSGPTSWRNGTFYPGVLALYRLSNDTRYLDGVTAIAEKAEWQLGDRLTHADDHTIGQTYLELYRIKNNPARIAPLRTAFDAILALPGKNPHGRWTWCDALFMAAPAWAELAQVTGEKKYLDYGDASFWTTHARLYSQEHHLFFRDGKYLQRKEANGQPMFWGRGNGWVMGALARTLPFIPKDHPSRSKYEQLLKEMAESLAKLQQPDGTWHSSLLDPASYPDLEMSGTGFIAYGIAWGVNNGILERPRFEPVLLKAWTAMNAQVSPEGKLLSVQGVGERPGKSTNSGLFTYGSGGFLLFSAELYVLLGQK